MTMMNILSGNGTSFFPPCTNPNECPVADEEKQRVAERGPSVCALTERCVSSCAAYGRVCPCTARIAAHYACDAMHELRKNSRVFVHQPEDGEATGEEDAEGKPNFPYLNAEDIVIGEKLGEGGFSNVNLCTVTKGNEAGQQFAVKYLKKRAMVDLHQFKHGAADLAIEAFFLQALDNPHIVKLHGVTAGSVATNVASGKECGFFIVVDRLTHTLEELLEEWRVEKDKQQHSGGIFHNFSSDAKEQKRAEFLERIKIALMIADAMCYLHSLDIIFRDLKPDNIGFDENGVLKLFDFGLAKELKPGTKRHDGKYKLTGNTGSRRYMAPEVAKECPYDKSVDVFSFGILLHELVSGEKPFYGYSSGKHMQQVVIGGERPKMDSQHTANWPTNFKCLLKHCWSAFPSLRPSFAEIKVVLQDILDGKEEVRSSLCNPAENGSGSAILSPSGGFIGGLFHPLSRKKTRAKTIGGSTSSGGSDADSDPPSPVKEGMKGLKPPAKAGRARTWGFGHRR